jgi:hypothetical protein
MPYDDPDITDPQELVGVELPGDPNVTRKMAAAFADEFAQLGYTHAEIVGLFRTPFYAAMHRTFQLLGAAEIARIVEESVAVWGRVRPVITDREDEGEAKPLRLIR